ncbi:DNA recombination protein RmuC [Olavius algarvensis Delta 1 endosymbiont]|nr:DNA recombination protein RmuC [Olavius algarvensis Delta 1 endosymbiont]
MASVADAVAAFITQYVMELVAGGTLLLVLTALILLILLIRRKPEGAIARLYDKLQDLDNEQARLENVVKDEITLNRRETAAGAQLARQELAATLKLSGDAIQQRLLDNFRIQKDQLDSFAKHLVAMARLNEEKIEAMRQTMEKKLRALQEDNTRKLELMRATVDEKLQITLEQRLGESFKQVSERLEQVYKGLGEMRALASGVGDLKNVLTNVKVRGIWGEIRLSHILEQILTPDQYAVNVATKKNSNDRVEFAVKLPGQGQEPDKAVWLPIDSKFPQEDYQRLIDAQEAADKNLAEKSIRSLEMRIKAEAGLIKEKYLDPPHTTDFGIMFLPVEGLYAEVLRLPGLCDLLQREHRIVVTGPTTLAALLNSLQMGFRTLAIEKRSSEVWVLLGMVKTEFGKFGDVLAKTKKKLQEAGNTIDQAEVRTRAIERKLRDVQEIPKAETGELIEGPDLRETLDVKNGNNNS